MANLDSARFNSQVVWAGCDPEQWKDWDVMPAVSMTSIYKQVAPGEFKRFDYSRLGNPTRAALEEALAKLDKGERGFVFTSGSAATVAVFNLLSAGDHIVVCDDLYPGTNHYLKSVLSRMNIEATFVDVTRVENVEAAIQPNTKMLFLETVSNPTLKVADLKSLSTLAHTINPDIVVVVDNTFLSPYFVRPLELGADIAVQSLSKFVNGHHDLIMGCAVVRREDLSTRLLLLQKLLGAVPGGPDCYLLLRSLKTLAVRIERQQENALTVARFLENHPRVDKVRHPLLPSHPQHELAKSQNGGHSGMICVFLKGTADNAKKFMMSLKLVLLATSLGGIVSSVALPWSMTAGELGKEVVEALGYTETMVRMSVGIEDIDDIIEDLTQALAVAYDN